MCLFGSALVTAFCPGKAAGSLAYVYGCHGHIAKMSPTLFCSLHMRTELNLLSPGRVFLSSSWELFYYYFSLAMTYLPFTAPHLFSDFLLGLIFSTVGQTVHFSLLPSAHIT